VVTTLPQPWTPFGRQQASRSTVVQAIFRDFAVGLSDSQATQSERHSWSVGQALALPPISIWDGAVSRTVVRVTVPWVEFHLSANSDQWTWWDSGAFANALQTFQRSVIVYDDQTRSMLQTDQRFPMVSSQNEKLQVNGDGSVDAYFGPNAPAGKESNWVQTIPGKGWNTMLRLDGPLDPWFDKTWRPGEIELVK
jgi:hypothetical protein